MSLLSDIGFPVKACRHSTDQLFNYSTSRPTSIRPRDQLFNFKVFKHPSMRSIIQILIPQVASPRYAP